MPPPHRPPARSVFGSLVLIAVVIGVVAGAFSYTAGWFSQRLTPNKMVDALTPPTGEPLGHRRNHAKGICFTGMFEANGAAVALSEARGFHPRSVSGHRALQSRHRRSGTSPDATVRVRGLGLLISTPDGQEWRTADD